MERSTGVRSPPLGPALVRRVPHFPPLCATSGHHSAQSGGPSMGEIAQRRSCAGPVAGRAIRPPARRRVRARRAVAPPTADVSARAAGASGPASRARTTRAWRDPARRPIEARWIRSRRSVRRDGELTVAAARRGRGPRPSVDRVRDGRGRSRVAAEPWPGGAARWRARERAGGRRRARAAGQRLGGGIRIWSPAAEAGAVRVPRVPVVDHAQRDPEVVGDAVQVVARPDRVDPAVRLVWARGRGACSGRSCGLVGFGVGWGVASGRRSARPGSASGAARASAAGSATASGRLGGWRRRRRWHGTADGLGATDAASTAARRSRSDDGSTSRSARSATARGRSRSSPARPAMTGRSMPPRCTTKPNEIPADSTRIEDRRDRRLRDGAVDRLAAVGSSSAAVPRR